MPSVILLQWRKADAACGSQCDPYFIFVMHCFAQPLLPFPCNPAWNIGAFWLTHRRKEKKKQTLIWELKMRYTLSHRKTTQTNSPKGERNKNKDKKTKPTFWKINSPRNVFATRVNFRIVLSQSKQQTALIIKLFADVQILLHSPT